MVDAFSIGNTDPMRLRELPGSSMGVDCDDLTGEFMRKVGGGDWRIQALGLFMPILRTRVVGDCDAIRFGLPACAERARSWASPTVGVLASATMLGMAF